MHLMEHVLPWYAGLRAVQLASTALKGHYHLLSHLIEEDRGQLGVQQGAELEGDLEGRGGRSGEVRPCTCPTGPFRGGQTRRRNILKSRLCRSWDGWGYQG